MNGDILSAHMSKIKIPIFCGNMFAGGQTVTAVIEF